MRLEAWLVFLAGCHAPAAPDVASSRGVAPLVEEETTSPASPRDRRTKTPSGIAWRPIDRGDGERHPQLNDEVEVRFTGYKANGSRFGGTDDDTAVFVVSKVIPGWTEILQLMVVGDRWRIEVPSELAYGDAPEQRGAPAGDLVFDIELVAIRPAPPIPHDVSAPPVDAMRTESGLAYRFLEEGDGTAHPGGIDEVRVHYSGWTTDGRMFDTSVTRGRPARFQVNAVLEGWTEMLSLMVVGDRVRVWIPPELAYGDRATPGRPHGMLVFEIELLGID